MLLSILVPTLQERHSVFALLRAKLSAQRQAAGLDAHVEILEFCDNRENSTGAKRNVLISRAQGTFVAFVDDDDEVADTYVKSICDALTAHPEVDCLGLMGLVYFRGVHPRRFVYSLRYDHYFSQGGVYYRPPYILNPIRQSLAAQVPFADVSVYEDADWALRVARANLLKREWMLDEILYHYYSRRRWYVQWAVDVTEPIRHPLGLRGANRLQVARWFGRLRYR